MRTSDRSNPTTARLTELQRLDWAEVRKSYESFGHRWEGTRAGIAAIVVGALLWSLTRFHAAATVFIAVGAITVASQPILNSIRWKVFVSGFEVGLELGVYRAFGLSVDDVIRLGDRETDDEFWKLVDAAIERRKRGEGQ